MPFRVKDVLIVNATVIIGLLILLTFQSISSSFIENEVYDFNKKWRDIMMVEAVNWELQLDCKLLNDDRDAYEDWFYQYLQTQQSQGKLESDPESSAQQGMVAQKGMSKVPDWVRNIFIWYGEEKISEDELLNAIKFLVNQGIIKVSP